MRCLKRAALLISVALTILVLCTACTGATVSEQSPQMYSELEASHTVARCLEEAGWSARVDPDSSVNVEVPKGQEQQYEAAAEECWSTVRPPSFDEINEQDRASYYAQFVKLRQCIVDMGIEMPAAPSYQAWNEMNGVWAPYVDIDPAVMQERWDDLQQRCPQISF